MYWEALGLPGSPVSQGVDELSKWLQWAQTGILAGASGNEDEIRYNLNQFWAQKKDYWETASPDEQAQMIRLDIYSKGLLNALNTGKIVSASPSYWDYWKTWLFGGNPSRPESTEAAVEARQAAQDAAKVAQDAGQYQMANYFRQQAEQVKDVVKQGNAEWNQSGNLNFFGIPWWAWAIGGAALLWYLYGPKVNK